MVKLQINHLITLEDAINELLEKTWDKIQHLDYPPKLVLMFNLEDDYEFGVGFLDDEKDLVQ